MDMEAVSSVISNSSTKEEDDEAAVLPGFRFHPTDEELVGFYLKRKVEKKPFSIELIKQIDIYKFDPWDLPKGSNVGDKEWYFFCKRGRKYRNSIRPNRVTGSGFWKATGIDRPIYSAVGHGHDCIGLKKSLVYYRGSAGKGTKTDWMMHEFRLPSEHDKSSIKHIDPKTIAQEAEVWTLCRILKRNVSYRKCMPDWRELPGNNFKQKNAVDASSKTCSMDFDPTYQTSNYISFTSNNNSNNIAPAVPSVNNNVMRAQAQNSTYLNLNKVGTGNHLIQKQQMVPLSSSSHPVVASNNIAAVVSNNSSFHGSSLGSAEFGELLKHGDWDELRSLFESAVAATAAAPVIL